MIKNSELVSAINNLFYGDNKLKSAIKDKHALKLAKKRAVESILEKYKDDVILETLRFLEKSD